MGGGKAEEDDEEGGDEIHDVLHRRIDLTIRPVILLVVVGDQEGDSLALFSARAMAP